MRGTAVRQKAWRRVNVGVRQTQTGLRSVWMASGWAVVILLVAGWGHRALVERTDQVLGQVMEVRRPLASLPLELGNWQGRDVSLDRRVMGAKHFDDDYINRLYYGPHLGTSVGVFVGYVGRPRARIGHRPDVCYAAHGWNQNSQENVSVTTPSGRRIPSVLYEFRSPDSFGSPLLILSTYMVNGRYVQDPEELDSWNTRNPGLLGERPAYLARIQVSLSSSGNRGADLAALREFTALVTESVVRIMPYWE